MRRIGLETALNDPRFARVIPKLERGQTCEVLERDDPHSAFALSNHAAVAVLLCKNWLRDPGTGARGKRLPDTRLVHIYDRFQEGHEYQQGFDIIMWSLRCVDPAADSVRWVLLKRALIRKAALWFDRTEQQDKLAWMYEQARQFEEDGSYLRPYLFCIGKPVACERFGKGRLREALEIKAKRRGGQLHDVRVHLGSINLQDEGG